MKNKRLGKDKPTPKPRVVLPTTQPKSSDWTKLRELIKEYAEAYVADSWKGGGDPADFEVVELQMKLSLAELNAHIDRMQRELS